MILEPLRRQPAHGYALAQNIQHRSSYPLQIKEGSLYPALQNIRKAKLVKEEWVISCSTNRLTRVYNVSLACLSHLECEVSSFKRMPEGVELVLRVTGRTANF